MSAGVKENKKLKEMDEAKKKREADEASPAIPAYSMTHIPGEGWKFITYQIKGDKIVDTHVKDCMDKDHAIESYKIAFTDSFIYGK